MVDQPSNNSNPSDSEQWSVQSAEQLYGINEWGAGYFNINSDGHVCVADPANPSKPSVSLIDVIAGLQKRGLEMPVLLRLENVLEQRIKEINEAFREAIDVSGYNNVYRGVFPIKVNQQSHVIEQIASYGAHYEHGLEAGSKAELIIALSTLANHNSPVICNGYKDAEFISLGLYARKLGIKCFFVVENPSEIPIILEQSKIIGVDPLIGVRIKLSTRVEGHWQADSGDRSIFGLSTAQLIDVVDQLKAAGKLDCLQLLHAHIGSQIPNIQNVRAGTSEACRYYLNLVKEGAPMGYLDMGGGLAVDYDGSASNWTHSMNYQLKEYCLDIIEAIIHSLDDSDVAHPVLITESGRATVAYSSVLLFNILDVSHSEPNDSLQPAGEEQAQDINDLTEILNNVNPRNLQESINDAHYYRDQTRELFRRGQSSLRTMALADNTFLKIMQRVIEEIPNATRVQPEIAALPESLADIYYGNFSVFQSLPDTWAIDQVFPVMPIHRLNEEPDRIALIADLTCDSDGRIAHFATPSGERKTLPLHALKDNEEYYLAVFLVGAYQETLGDLHNLFGDTNIATIRLNGKGDFEVEGELQGDSIADVLSYVEYNPKQVFERLRDKAEKGIRAGIITVEDRQTMLKGFSESLNGYTYFEK